MEVITAEQAAELIPDGATIIPGGFGSCGHPDLLTMAVERRFKTTGSPRNLNLIFASGAGNKQGMGLDRLAHEGLVGKAIGGFWGLCPELCNLGEQGILEAHNWPQGVVSKLFRAMAEKSLGVITRVGMNTFVDPRLEGGVFLPGCYPTAIKEIVVEGERHLLYPAQRPDIALLRGSFCDAKGNISLMDEASNMDTLSQAQAVRNAGGENHRPGQDPG